LLDDAEPLDESAARAHIAASVTACLLAEELS
jgi:hypothetical protein